MDADMVTMMMNQIEKLPDFCDSLNPHNITALTDLHHHHQINFSNPKRSPLSPSSSSDTQPPYAITPPMAFGTSNPPQHELVTHPKMRQGAVFQGMSSNPYHSGSFCRGSNDMAAMREMIFRIAVMQPIHIDPESVKPPKRRNVKISKDPQSVAARHRRERISERIRILQRLVPGGTKMDTASMLDEAVHYVKFLKKQVQTLEEQATTSNVKTTNLMNSPIGTVNDFAVMPNLRMGSAVNANGGHMPSSTGFKACGQVPCHQMVGNVHMLR